MTSASDSAWARREGRAMTGDNSHDCPILHVDMDAFFAAGPGAVAGHGRGTNTPSDHPLRHLGREHGLAQRVATRCSWLARVRYSGRSDTARSSSSREACLLYTSDAADD